MKPWVSVGRGMVQIKNLKPGMPFVSGDKIAVKRSSSSGGAWSCIVIGTGDELYDYSMKHEDFNDMWVTPIWIDLKGDE
ncbi:MAG: hypothetical protein JSU04_00165 [Bdellovibrionales bacterium]|nr:hypothetical protein [Bdellovibrionales bacterium]